MTTMIAFGVYAVAAAAFYGLVRARSPHIEAEERTHPAPLNDAPVGGAQIIHLPIGRKASAEDRKAA